MPLNPLNTHYSFTAAGSIHDEEAMTALELAGKTAAKVNEAIQAFNTHEQKTQEHLLQQDLDISNLKYKTLPLHVQTEILRQINNGNFDLAISQYAGQLEARIDNLLGKIPEGGTTSAMDAEIIDARLGADATQYRTLGEAIRTTSTVAQIKTQGTLDFIVEKIDDAEKQVTNGYYKKNGEFQDYSGSRSIKISVKPGEVYVYDIMYGYDVVDAVIIDSDGKVIRYYNESEEPRRVNKTFPIVIPTGANFLAVNTFALKTTGGRNFWGDVYRVTGARVNDKSTIDYIDRRVGLLDAKPVIGADVTGNTMEKSYIYSESESVETIDGKIYFTKSCAVTPGEILYIEGSASYKNFVYTFYSNGIPLGENLRDAENNRQVVFSGVVRVPAAADMIHVASEKGSAPVVKYVAKFTVGDGEFSGVKWCAMGDSLTEKNHRALMHYHDYIAQKTNIVVHNHGLSGAGYMKRQDEEKAFYHLVETIPDDTNCITIFGSGNDLLLPLGNPTDTGTTTVCGCVNTTIDRIYARFPLVPLGIVSPTPWDGNNPVNANNHMAVYSEALRQICFNRGIPFLDLYHCSGLRPWDAGFRSLAYSRDPVGTGCHPDENGHKMIAPRFYAFLKSLIGTY